MISSQKIKEQETEEIAYRQRVEKAALNARKFVKMHSEFDFSDTLHIFLNLDITPAARLIRSLEASGIYRFARSSYQAAHGIKSK